MGDVHFDFLCPDLAGGNSSAVKQNRGQKMMHREKTAPVDTERLIPIRSAILSKRFDKMWQLAYISPPKLKCTQENAYS
jgi:hypothetical protein